MVFFLLVVADSQVLAQQRDTLVLNNDTTLQTKAVKKAIYSEARKASVMSALLPGLGQGYNRKYWKIPVIYGALGGFAYVFVTNNTEYQYYRKNLIAFYDDDPNTTNNSFYQGDQLKTQKDYYKKLRDIGIIGMGIVYILNIVDANVDAHLKTFDVSDDLGLIVDPFYLPASYRNKTGHAAGITLKLNFK